MTRTRDRARSAILSFRSEEPLCSCACPRCTPPPGHALSSTVSPALLLPGNRLQSISTATDDVHHSLTLSLSLSLVLPDIYIYIYIYIYIVANEILTMFPEVSVLSGCVQFSAAATRPEPIERDRNFGPRSETGSYAGNWQNRVPGNGTIARQPAIDGGERTST